MTDIVPVDGFTREQVDLIKRTIAKDASDDELKLFLYQAKRTGLDPFARQIHFTKRKSDGESRATIVVGIDGYRLVAERTGKYAGNDEPVYETNDDGKPVKARVTVWKLVDGQRCPFSASALWDEYAPKGGAGFMWNKMPFLMLGKVAEALALRKAFPADLSGIYVQEEMDQAADEPKRSTVVATTPALEAPKPANGTAERPSVHPDKAEWTDSALKGHIGAPMNQTSTTVAITRSPYVCKDCGKQITSVRTRAGKEFSAKVIAERSIDDYHRQLCWDCSLKAHEAKRQAELAMAAPLPPMADDDIEEPVPA
jgi:phage recombination protein Bet